MLKVNSEPPSGPILNAQAEISKSGENKQEKSNESEEEEEESEEDKIISPGAEVPQ